MIALVLLLITPLIFGDINPGSDHCTLSRRCPTNQDWDRSARADVLKARCYCDQKCVLFNDCCFYVDKKIIPLIQSGIKCTNENLPEPYYLQQKCPHATSNQLKALCENASYHDPLTMVPVTSLSRFFTYKNIFCAICNGEQVSDLHMWNTVVTCGVDNNKFVRGELLRNSLRFDFKEKQWKMEPNFMNAQHKDTYCHNTFSFPPALVRSFTQKCQKHVAECANDWKREDVEKYCLTRNMALVYGKMGHVYKNVYCAVCNHENLKDLQCQISEEVYNYAQRQDRLLQSLYSTGEYLACEKTEKTLVHDIECTKEKLMKGLCTTNDNEFKGIKSENVKNCKLAVVLRAKPTYRFSPIFCSRGFVYDIFVNQCRSASGKIAHPRPEKKQ